VSVKTPAKLAEKIVALLAGPGECERMGQGGRRRVEQVFELGDCTREVVETLELRDPLKSMRLYDFVLSRRTYQTVGFEEPYEA